jgi:hypothetical protein
MQQISTREKYKFDYGFPIFCYFVGMATGWLILIFIKLVILS